MLLGTGTGSFRGPVIVDAGTSPDAVAVGDFNGDGRPDVVTSNSSSDNVSVLLNDGTWPATDTPSITVNDVTVTEGNSGTTAATFTVSLSAAYGQPVTIHYATADGSAIAGSDYQAASGTLTFAPGVTSQTITVLVNGDRDAESSESFLLLLTSPTNAFVDDPSGTGTILDDEPFVDISGSSGAEGNSGTTPFTFTVTLSAAYDVPVTVDYDTSDLTSDEIVLVRPDRRHGRRRLHGQVGDGDHRRRPDQRDDHRAGQRRPSGRVGRVLLRLPHGDDRRAHQ